MHSDNTDVQNDGVIAEATVKVSSNGVLGELTVVTKER